MRRADRMRPRHAALLHDAWIDVIAHPVRALLSSLGTVLGVGVLIATVGTTESASAHIVSIVDELSARQIQVFNPPAGADGAPGDGSFGFDAARRVERVDGVQAAATVTRIRDVSIRSGAPTRAPGPDDALVVAADAHSFAIVGATVEGRTYDDVDPTLPVAVVGRSLASQLDLPVLERGPSVEVGGRDIRVVGILTRSETRPDLLGAVMVPEALARERLGLVAPESVVVTVRPGASSIVADQLGLALVPAHPDGIDVVAPPEPTFLRDGITTQTRGLLLAVGALCLALGAVGIANITLVSVLERRPEIGLRRALGARRRHIVVHFLFESALVGILGAAMGMALGIVAIVVVSETQGWRPVVEAGWLAGAPALGVAVGVVAGLYPAIRSGHLEPVEALRSV